MTNSYFQIIVWLILCMVPWPGPSVFKITCSRESAATVRQLVQKKWIPVLEKYQVRLPLECPFHPFRDIFQPQEAAKHQYHASQWTCGFCGKSFYHEPNLDQHFDNKHKNQINMAEDAVCLADYCDIMRCEVLKTREKKKYLNMENFEQNVKTTDLEVWREPSQRNTALLVVSSNAKVEFHTTPVDSSSGSISAVKNLCEKHDAPIVKDDDFRNYSDKCEPLIDSAVPQKQRFIELQKLRVNCKPEELLKLRIKCEVLIRDCIAGLLVNLSVQDFRDIEEELNNSFCWYLTCDRYWEDTPNDTKHFSWALFFVPAIILSVGLSICYYIIWVLFDSDDAGLNHSNSRKSKGLCYTTQYGEEYYSADDNPSSNDHYIYVTYPPEIKQRLLDSCPFFVEEQSYTHSTTNSVIADFITKQSTHYRRI